MPLSDRGGRESWVNRGIGATQQLRHGELHVAAIRHKRAQDGTIRRYARESGVLNGECDRDPPPDAFSDGGLTRAQRVQQTAQQKGVSLGLRIHQWWQRENGSGERCLARSYTQGSTEADGGDGRVLAATWISSLYQRQRSAECELPSQETSRRLRNWQVKERCDVFEITGAVVNWRCAEQQDLRRAAQRCGALVPSR